MTFEGLHNQKICAEEHQPQVTLAKNRKNCKRVARTAEVELNEELASTEAYSSVCNNL